MVKPMIIRVLTTASLVFMAATAAAESVDGDRFSLSLGVFVTDRDTEAELDGTVGVGTPTDLESDLGLDASDSVFRIDGYYRFNERHRIDFSVFDLSRNASKQIDEQIQWGDTLYDIDTVIKSNVDLAIYKAAYTYSFLDREDGYLGATGGFYVLDTKASLKEQTLGSAESGDLTAPLPVIGLRGDYALSDRWTLRASAEFFFVEYDNVEGSLVDLYAGVDFSVLDHLSIGLGINTVTLDVDISESGFHGGLDWRYSGGLIFLKFDF